MIYRSFKKINKPALLYGLPFLVFFILIAWVIVIGLGLFLAKKFSVRIILSVILLSGIILIFVIYKKIGLKKSLKLYDLFFKEKNIIKFNKPLKVKKINLDDDN